ncbi:tyrosine-type recombinase/integrase [Clostridium sp. BJN0013]|uniref:tyrosine-type recombinase/integrase n=1 Tax=Clostridium sp. BJN0013 TaxID=3236840 RepID=UPI0034C6D8A8
MSKTVIALGFICATALGLTAMVIVGTYFKDKIEIKGSNFYIPLQVALNTGMRAGEVCGLTWDCVNLEDKFIKAEKILIGKGKCIWEFGTPKTFRRYTCHPKINYGGKWVGKPIFYIALFCIIIGIPYYPSYTLHIILAIK